MSADPQTAALTIGAFGAGFGVASLLWAVCLVRDLPNLINRQLARLNVVQLDRYRSAATAIAAAAALQPNRRQT